MERKPSHKRKPIDEKEVGKYTKYSLVQALRAVFKGDKSTAEAKEAFGPSVRTINRHLQ